MSGSLWDTLVGKVGDELYNQGREFALTATNLPVGLLAQVLPAGQDAQGNVHPAVPGLLTSLYNAAGSIAPDLASYATGVPLGHLPGADAAGRSYDESLALARNFPHMEGQTDREKIFERGGEAAGGMLVPIPGAAFSGLGKAGSIAAHVIVPTAEGMKVGGPVGGAMGAAGEIANQYLTGGKPDAFNLGTVPTDQDQGDRFDLSPSMGAATPDTFDLSGQRAPNYGLQTGETGWTTGETAGAFLAGAAAIAIGLKYGGRTMVQAADAFRGGKQAVIDASMEAKQALAADPLRGIIGMEPGVNPRGEVALPGTEARSLGNRFAQYWQDKTAAMRAAYDAIAESPDRAKEMQAALGTVLDNSAVGRMIQTMFRTGVEKFTGFVMPKLTPWIQEIRSLDEGDTQLLDAAMNAKNEINWRDAEARAQATGGGLAPGQYGPPAGPNPTLLGANRVRYQDVGTAELRDIVSQAERVPQLKRLMDTMWTMGSRNLDYLEQIGYITTADKMAILKDHPNYVPSVDENGRILHILDRGQLGAFEGGQFTPQYAWDAFVQHQDALYRDAWKNSVTRAYVLDFIKAQDRDPKMGKVFEEKLGKDLQPAAGPLERTVTVRTSSGPRTFYVDNSYLYNAIKGPPAQQNLALNTLSFWRRQLQAGVTGPLAALGGRFFAPIQGLIRTPMEMGFMANPETRRGLMDIGMKALTGDRVGYAGWDPTSHLGAAVVGGQNLVSVFAKNLSQILKTPDNPMTMALRSALGDTPIDALAAKFENYYTTSGLAREHAVGLGGQGAQGGVELPTNVNQATTLGQKLSQARNPLGDVVPGVLGNPTIPGTRVPIPSTISHSYMNLRGLVREIHETISGAGQSYYFRLNEGQPGMTPNRLGFEARRLIGDPGTAGAGPAARTMSAAVPYFNVSMQDAARYVQRFKEAPITFSLGAMTPLVVAAAASNLSAMMSGPAHVDHLENQVSTQQREGNVVIYHGVGTDPTDHTMLSLPQKMRWLYPAVLEMVSTAIGASRAHGDENAFNRTIDMLSDVFSHHVSNATMVSSAKGLNEFLGFWGQVPPAMNAAIAAFAQKNTNVNLSTMAYNYLTNRPLTDGMSSDLVPSHGPPNDSSYDSLVTKNDGKLVQSVLSSILGIAGNAYDMAHNFAKRHDLDPSMRLTMAADDYRHALMDNTPYANSIWGNNLSNTQKTPLEENNDRAWAAIRDTAGASTDVKAQGLTRSGGLPISQSGTPKVPEDPVMRQMYFTVSRTSSGMMSRVHSNINDLRTQLQDVRDSGLSAETKRFQMNKIAKQIQDQHSMFGGFVQQLNTELSQIVGKPVDINHINWKEGPEQFN